MSRTDESASDDRKANDAGLLDRAVDAVRAEAAPASEADAARRRVWQRLQDAADAGPQSAPAAVDPGAPIKGCADVRALLGAYRAGTLSSARQLLVQMHLRDCVTCREAHANRTHRDDCARGSN